MPRYQLWDAGEANAVPNKDWYLYAKPKDCATCPAGSIKSPQLALPDDTAPDRPVVRYQVGVATVGMHALFGLGAQLNPLRGDDLQCADQGNGMGKNDNAVIFCTVPTPNWGNAFLLVAGFLGAAYLGETAAGTRSVGFANGL